MKFGDLVYDEYYGTCLVLEMDESSAKICVLEPELGEPLLERVSIETLDMMEIISESR